MTDQTVVKFTALDANNIPVIVTLFISVNGFITAAVVNPDPVKH